MPPSKTSSPPWPRPEATTDLSFPWSGGSSLARLDPPCECSPSSEPPSAEGIMSNPTPARPDRTWLYVAVGFLVVWGLYLKIFGPSGPRGGAPTLDGSGLASPAEFSWTLEDLDG